MDKCDTCGEAFKSFAAYQRHNCNGEDDPPKLESLFGVEELKQERKEHRRNNRWLERHNYL